MKAEQPHEARVAFRRGDDVSGELDVRPGDDGLYGEIQEHTGQTFVEYRNRLRFEQACRELRESKLNIAEIAWPPAGCP